MAKKDTLNPPSDDGREALGPKSISADRAGVPYLQDSASALPIGTRLGEFEVSSLLGEGGFGIVYLAHDISLERSVALKEYLPSALAARVSGHQVQVKSERHREAFSAGLKSFINEARLLASFDHPSLVKVYRFWEANGTAYMVMPFYNGKTLKDMLREQSGPPDEAWLRGLLAPLTEALAVIHAERCYHRDIAPDNVMMLAGSDRPLLLDFGAARRVIGDMTQALTVILKPGYAPIEQYAETPGMEQGPWTDVFALAAVVYFAIMGETPPSSVGRLINDTYVPLAQAAAGRYSESFLAAIDRALTVQPGNRTQSIAELRKDLEMDELVFGARLQMPSLIGDNGTPKQRRSTTEPLRRHTTEPEDGRTILQPPGPAWTDLPPLVPRIAPSDQTQFIAPAPNADASRPFDARIMVTSSKDLHAIGRSVLHQGRRLEIGRACEGLEINDPECSRPHAAIDLTPDGYRIVDLDSLNTTHVNGRRLIPGVPVPLLFGSAIRIGSTFLAFTQGSNLQTDLSGSELAGQYLLHEKLRSSPKGAIYRATTKVSNIPVAVKILAQHASSVTDYRAQFEAEAIIAKQLRHPHICELRDYGHGDIVAASGGTQVSYLCYSLLAGGNLEDRLGSGKFPAPEEAVAWVTHIAEALNYAHDHAVLHGNVKPSAICFDDSGHVYVTDFAIAEKAAGVHLGAPAYMAPEQWTGGEITAHADQFSLAVLTYLMLAGSRPFEGQEDPRIRERNFRRGPEPAHLEADRNDRPKFPPAVSAVLARAMLIEPVQRFNAVSDFAQELRDAMRRRGIDAGRSPEVFISYQRGPSSAWAVMIQAELRDKHQIKAFVDSGRFDGAVRFPEKIGRAVRECEVFVCLLSSTTLKSRWVLEEIRAAHEAQRPMIPIFQESFKRHAPLPDDPAVHALMQYDGLELLDRRNIHIHHTINDLIRQIRLTLDSRPSS